jgi:hypothetical protein
MKATKHANLFARSYDTLMFLIMKEWSGWDFEQYSSVNSSALWIDNKAPKKAG